MKTILDLLETIYGTRNVMDLKYRQIDETTKRSDMDFSGMDSNKFLLPAETDKMIEDYLKTELP